MLRKLIFEYSKIRLWVTYFNYFSALFVITCINSLYMDVVNWWSNDLKVNKDIEIEFTIKYWIFVSFQTFKIDLLQKFTQHLYLMFPSFQKQLTKQNNFRNWQVFTLRTAEVNIQIFTGWCLPAHAWIFSPFIFWNNSWPHIIANLIFWKLTNHLSLFLTLEKRYGELSLLGFGPLM